MPVLQPAEPWEKTGRYAIEELFKLEDRKGSPMVLAMTHEEAITYHVAREVRSYRDLPLMLFQIQTKERDEPRPRAGLLRTREFTMKDAYSFDRDEEGLARSYEAQAGAYERILDRCGLRWLPVRVRRRDDGRLRRRRVHGALPGRRERGGAGARLRRQRRGRLGRAAAGGAAGAAARARAGRDARPDHGRGGLRLARPAGRRPDQGDADRRRGPRPGARAPARRPPAQRDQAAQRDGDRLPPGPPGGDRGRARPGRLHRPGRRRAADDQGRGDRRRLLRLRRQRGRTPTCAGSTPAATSRPTRWTCARSRPATPPPAAATIAIEPAIEVGNIFKLGTRYSEPLGATYLDESGARGRS